MESATKTRVTVETTIKAGIEDVWNFWVRPEHITKWNTATPDWHCPKAENDLRDGGKFSSRMEARDGSIGFDFGGTYDEVKIYELIRYTMGDGRKVEILFREKDGETTVTETFDAEDQNSIELQRSGWQSIMDNFKKYAEASSN